MNIKKKKAGDVQIISLEGQLLGEPDVSQLSQTITRLLQEQKRKKVVLDLAGVKYINSSGLGLLVSFLASLKKHGGDLCLVGMNDRVESILIVTRLIRVFRFYKSVDRALSSFS